MGFTICEQVTYATIRIECIYLDGSRGTGTGFFFNFCDDDPSKGSIPTIITNKHVVENAQIGTLIFTKKGDDDLPKDTEHFRINLSNYRSSWIDHPDKNVDLCALPIAGILNEAEKRNEKLFYIHLNKSIIPNEQQLNELDAMEEITMIGYPNGLWDETNNKPIFRKGITATNLNFDYNGKREFLIDAACYPGSSGSPVMLINMSGYRDKKGNLNVGSTRVYLLGVLYAGPQHPTIGEVKVINVPVANVPVAVSKIPNNLGYVIKADRIRDFELLFRQMI